MGIDMNATIFHVFSFLQLANNDSPRTANKKQKNERQQSHIKGSCWAVNLYMKKQVVFFSWENTGHVLQEPLHEASYMETAGQQWGRWGLTCESTERVGCGLQAQGIQCHRLGQGPGLSLGQQLWEQVGPGCEPEGVFRLRREHLNNRLLRTQEDTYMMKLKLLSKSNIQEQYTVAHWPHSSLNHQTDQGEVKEGMQIISFAWYRAATINGSIEQ